MANECKYAGNKSQVMYHMELFIQSSCFTEVVITAARIRLM